jgi:predicted phage terminase large subunit-like protein
MDHDERYVRLEYFLPMEDEDYSVPATYAAAIDFAVSTKDTANRTSISVGCKDARNILHHRDQRVGRWDAQQIIDEMFAVAARWNPDVFFVEDGVIWKALAPTVNLEMRRRDEFINIQAINPTQDKAVRARPMQKRMKAGANRYDKRASWYAEFEAELLSFVAGAEAILDDQFDSAALLNKGFDTLVDVEEDDFKPEEEEEFDRMAMMYKGGNEGRSVVTGY